MGPEIVLRALLLLDEPTAEQVDEARRLAAGRFENRLWAMEERRRSAFPTPEERLEDERAFQELLEAMDAKD